MRGGLVVTSLAAQTKDPRFDSCPSQNQKWKRLYDLFVRVICQLLIAGKPHHSNKAFDSEAKNVVL